MPEAHVPYLLASFSIPSPLPAYLNSAAVLVVYMLMAGANAKHMVFISTFTKI